MIDEPWVALLALTLLNVAVSSVALVVSAVALAASGTLSKDDR